MNSLHELKTDSSHLLCTAVSLSIITLWLTWSFSNYKDPVISREASRRIFMLQYLKWPQEEDGSAALLVWYRVLIINPRSATFLWTRCRSKSLWSHTKPMLEKVPRVVRERRRELSCIVNSKLRCKLTTKRHWRLILCFPRFGTLTQCSNCQ